MFNAPHPHDLDLRAIAFYLPQYHPVPENDAFWGAGFTEWRNVVAARPRFRDHEQPHLPADLGFYDLRLDEVRLAQAELAKSAGLSGFCYYHYWFGGKRLLSRPMDQMLASGQPAFPFMAAWANENWTRAWDGGAQEILIAQDYSDADTIAHARHMASIFADPRYIRINGRPVFAIYNADALPDPRRWCDRFKETSLVFDAEPYLIRIERHLDQDTRPPADLGFDAALEFQPFSRNFLAWLKARPDLKRHPVKRLVNRLKREIDRKYYPLDRHFDIEAFIAFDTCQTSPAYTLFPGVTPSWDNSARRPPGKALIFRNSSPDGFADWVHAKALAFTPPSPDENLIFVNAWNEWAEGNHLEPCLRHGHGWMDALRSGLESATYTRSNHAVVR